jgi:glucose uptake protein
MFVVQSYFLAIIFCFVTMLCWGSWANTQKLASKKWDFQLFYWDYSIGLVLFSLLMAFTLGSFGSVGRGFIEDITQANNASMTNAFIGGVFFNLANILLVVAIDIAGMSVAFPIGIGLALVIGVIDNYLKNPSANGLFIFSGVLFIVIAILLNAIAYTKLPSQKSNSKKGIIISLICGVLMGFFYGFVSDSMTNDFVKPEVGKLTPYTALFIFSLGVFLSNFVFNTFNMYKPITGNKTSFKKYFTLGTPKLHLIGVIGGVIWGIGMGLNILSSNVASPAVSYGLGQGATMVAAFWGVFVWKEFKLGMIIYSKN